MTTAMEIEVIKSTYARKLREGDRFVVRRNRRGRPAFEDQPQDVYVVRQNAEVVDGSRVKVFVEGRHRAFIYDIDFRVRLV